MKPALVPILSGVALAIMAGASVTHCLSVRQMVAIARISQPDGMPMIRGGPARLAANLPGKASTDLDGLKRQNATLQQVLAKNEATLASLDLQPASTAGGDADLKRLLAELVSQNRYLRDQIAETNRDLMELQFRVDTHSEQFRPLNLQAEDDFAPLDESSYDTSIGVLPPLDLP